jgi:hypothetical protein
MNLGTGIFLSSSVLAIVLLYGFTKDRWRWRKIVIRTLFSILILVVGSAAVIALANYWDEIFPVQVGPQTQYAGLKLGMSPQDVMYVKGYPPTVLEEDADVAWKVVKTSELAKGKQATDYRHWSYEQYKSNLNIKFNKERSEVVAISCYSEDKLTRCPLIGNVSDGTSEKDVFRKLAAQAEQRMEGVSKQLRFPSLGVKLWLTKEEVYMLAIYDQQSN